MKSRCIGTGGHEKNRQKYPGNEYIAAGVLPSLAVFGGGSLAQQRAQEYVTYQGYLNALNNGSLQGADARNFFFSFVTDFNRNAFVGMEVGAGYLYLGFDEYDHRMFAPRENLAAFTTADFNPFGMFVVSGGQQNGGEGLLESMWNSPFARWLIPDKLSFSMGGDIAAFIGVGAQPVNFSILTRGKEPGVYLTPTFTVNAGIGATASGGFSFGVSTYTGDPRNITSSMISGSSHGGMVTGGFLGDISISGSYSNTKDGYGFINGGISFGVGFGGFGGYQYQYTSGAAKLWVGN